MQKIRLIKVGVFFVCLVPLALLFWDAWQHQLGANPIEKVTRRLGDWGLRMLWITLAITPLRCLTGWNDLIKLRRMLGLYAFFYATLHVASYVVLDQFFDWSAILKDIIKHKFITVGMLAFVLLIPLAVTSTNTMMRRLGRRWQILHRSVYVIAVLIALHYFWMVKADILEPTIYAIVLAGLLAYRFWHARARAVIARSPKLRNAD